MTTLADYLPLDNEQFLDALDEERLPSRKEGNPYREPDGALLREMVDELIRRGVYPAETVEGNPNNVLTMVTGWGARWHEWREPFSCAHCKADLRDHRTGPPFKREIGMVDRYRDRTTHFVCPDCKQTI